jgi:glycosyltransferase involved in cell wall biosynthesis
MTPGISICITAYSASKYLGQCVASVMQTFRAAMCCWEVMVGVDGCADTLAAAKLLQRSYPQLRVLWIPVNSGTYVATNTLLSARRHEHILRFDSDDVMCPDAPVHAQRGLYPMAFHQLSYVNFTG